MVLFAILASAPAQINKPSANYPEKIVIAANSFMDIGPPFDSYDVFWLESQGDKVLLQRVLITPAGDACTVPATVSARSTVIDSSMAQLIGGKNPCDIPDKELRREMKRCKHCLTFSGVNVAMHTSCQGTDRNLRMDILDRDMFSSQADTPSNTSWTMQLLSKLDKLVSAPTLMDRPIFATAPAATVDTLSDIPVMSALASGKLDQLFETKAPLSQMYREAQVPVVPPSVKLVGAPSLNPITSALPTYPPIARAAHVTGQVETQFKVSPDGHTEEVTFVNGPLMLRPPIETALKSWRFPPAEASRTASATFAFDMPCASLQAPSGGPTTGRK